MEYSNTGLQIINKLTNIELLNIEFKHLFVFNTLIFMFMSYNIIEYIIKNKNKIDFYNIDFLFDVIIWIMCIGIYCKLISVYNIITPFFNLYFKKSI